jgi:hypothetical protein
VKEFIDHLYTPLVTTGNYSAMSDLHTLQLTPFPVCCVLSSRSLVTSSKGGSSSLSSAQVLSSEPPCKTLVKCQFIYSAICSQPHLQNLTELSQSPLPTINSLSQSPSQVTWDSRYKPRGGPNRKHRFNNSLVLGEFTNPLPRNGHLLIRLLHNNGRTRFFFRGLWSATGLYATIFKMLPYCLI